MSHAKQTSKEASKQASLFSPIKIQKKYMKELKLKIQSDFD